MATSGRSPLAELLAREFDSRRVHMLARIEGMLPSKRMEAQSSQGGDRIEVWHLDDAR